MASTVSRRGSGSGRRRRAMNDINMVPFIDVMLVLLIIFMVTAPLITPSVIDIPSVGQAARTPDRVITVEIGRDQQIEIRSRSNDPQGVATHQSANLENVARQTLALQGSQTQTPVVISADRSIRYEQVVQVMDRLQRAGVQRIGLSVKLNP